MVKINGSETALGPFIRHLNLLMTMIDQKVAFLNFISCAIYNPDLQPIDFIY